jgi:hypothetical protein
MKDLNLKEAVQSQVADAGEVKAGVARFAKKFTEEVIRDRKIPATDFSIKEMFEATTLVEYPDLDVNDKLKFSEAVNGSQFPYLTKELIHREMIPTYEDGLQGADMLVTELDTKRYDEDNMVGTTAMSTMPLVRPGQPYPSADFGEKYFTCKITNHGQILDMSKELILSDQTGSIVDRANQAGMVMGQHRHQYIVETLIVAPRTAVEETTSTACTYKGTAITASNFFSNDHSAYDGQTNDNLAASSAIGTAGMDTAMGLLLSMKDEKGRVIAVTPKVLVCHPTKARTAWQLLMDSDLSTVDSANRGRNYYQQKYNIQVFQTPFVTQNSGLSSDWYVGDPKRALVWLWYQKPAVERQGANSDAAFERDVVLRFRMSYWGGCAYREVGRFMVKATA